ncbi:Flp family type IVb pilin [Phenylobacterium sp.]|jgi:pilus assembly protein Flp/PilA|uniref:Flp family type IVb pilin n=1 Tax=Phenylobacterium sp. TaxID=1871053 RepID=UPI002F958E9F
MTKMFKKFAGDRSGATAIEYGLMAALIALAIAVGAGVLGTGISDKFETVASDLAAS